MDAINKDNLSWIHTKLTFNSWDSEVAKDYNISAIPYNILIGPDGMVLDKLLKQDRLYEVLPDK